jgi:hypothetical protein
MHFKHERIRKLPDFVETPFRPGALCTCNASLPGSRDDADQKRNDD